MPLTYRERIQQLMDDALAEAELPGENTAMLRPREDEESDLPPVKVSAPAVSEVPPAELPEPVEPEESLSAEVPQRATGGPREPAELPPPSSVESGETPAPPESESLELPPVELPAPSEIGPTERLEIQVQVEDQPDADIREFFLDADWQPPADFGELPAIEGIEPDERRESWDPLQDIITELDQGGGW